MAWTIADIKKTAEQKMQKSLEALKHDLGKVRTGRAHTGLLDHITVDYYGTPTPINQVANVTLLDARTIGVHAVREEDGAGGREGDPRFRPRAQPGHRGRHDPRADAGAHRGAPPRPDQGGASTRARTPRWRCATCAATPTPT